MGAAKCKVWRNWTIMGQTGKGIVLDLWKGLIFINEVRKNILKLRVS